MTLSQAQPAQQAAARPIDSLKIDEATQRLLFLEARSNTVFADRSVPESLIHDVYDLVKWGPTGNNAGPMRIVIASSLTARAAVIASASLTNQPKLAAAPLILVVARDNRYHDHFGVTSPGSEAAQLRLEAEAAEREMKAHNGTWLQAAYTIIGLRAAGLAVRPYGGFDAAALDTALLAHTSWSSEMLLAVGYPEFNEHGAGPRKGRVSAQTAVVQL